MTNYELSQKISKHQQYLNQNAYKLCPSKEDKKLMKYHFNLVRLFTNKLKRRGFPV